MRITGRVLFAKPKSQIYSHQIYQLSLQQLANTITVAVYKKQSLSFSHQFHLQTVYCAFQDSDYGSIYLESPCCSVLGAQPAHSPVGPGRQIFGLITLPLVMNYALLESAEKTQELKVLVKSVRTGHAYNFQDMWK